MHFRFAVCLCLPIAGSPTLAQAQKVEVPTKSAGAIVVAEPRDIVAALYKRVAAEAKKASPSSPFLDRDTRQKHFSKSFDLLITTVETKAAHDGTKPIDFDPITASQDIDAKTSTLKTEVLELGKAVVSASFTNGGKLAVVTYDFIKEDGAWAIDDIKGTTDDEAWSMRKIMKGTGKEPTALPGMKDAKAEKSTAD